ncbi:hypothetical protein DFP73DRAFT_216432 [Morchella snyderi]|nr:hypothetical protein DFP73DRAFT_216432 [Morchella snyderi]
MRPSFRVFRHIIFPLLSSFAFVNSNSSIQKHPSTSQLSFISSFFQLLPIRAPLLLIIWNIATSQSLGWSCFLLFFSFLYLHSPHLRHLHLLHPFLLK